MARTLTQTSPIAPTKKASFNFLLFPLIGGLLMACGPAPLNLWFLPWIAIVPLWWSVQHQRFSFRSGLLWGLVYHGISLAWITGLHPLTWMGISYVNSVAIVAVIWLFITLYGAVSVGLWASVLAWATRKKLNKTSRILLAVTCWCGIEWLRSLSILDWTSIAYTQSPGNLPILHLGQLSGNTAITAAIVAVNGAIVENLPAEFSKLRLKSFKFLLPAIGLFIAFHLLGGSLSLAAKPDNSANSPVQPIKIGSVQGNIPTRIKLTAPGIFQAYQNYGKGYEFLANQGAQMVVFSEGSIPESWSNELQNPIVQSVKNLKVPLALGAWGTRPGTKGEPRSTQALLMLDDRAQITSQYDKIKVVPLGEALPFEEILGQYIGRLSSVRSFLIPGKTDQIFKTPFGQAAIGICYESAFSEILRAQIQRGAEFIITASNLDPYNTILMSQHEAHDVMRAVETDRNLLRVTNTGYSGLIQSTGQQKWRSQPQSYDLHLSEVFPRNTQTLYVRYGNWLLPLFVFLSLVAIINPISKSNLPKQS